MDTGAVEDPDKHDYVNMDVSDGTSAAPPRPARRASAPVGILSAENKYWYLVWALAHHALGS